MKVYNLIIFSTIVLITCFSQNSVFSYQEPSGGAQIRTIEDRDISDSLTFIQGALDKGAVTAKRWQYSWMLFHGTNAYLSLGTSITMDDPDDSDIRFDSRVHFVLSTYAFTSLYFTPVPAKNAAELLRKIPTTTPIERRLALQIAEAYLSSCVSAAKGWRSWKPHVYSGLVNAAGSMTIAFGDDRKKDGLVNFCIGMLIAEFQIFTAPNRAIDDWEEYNRRFNRSYLSHNHSRHQAPHWTRNIHFFAYHSGLGIQYHF